MNRFVAASSVADHHVIMLDGESNVLYSGPLRGVSEIDFNRAVVSLVNPMTLDWVKTQADAAIKRNPALAWRG